MLPQTWQVLLAIPAASQPSRQRTTATAERSYCKNETRHNLLTYLRLGSKRGAEFSAIAEASAHLIGTTVHGARSAVGHTEPTRSKVRCSIWLTRTLMWL